MGRKDKAQRQDDYLKNVRRREVMEQVNTKFESVKSSLTFLQGQFKRYEIRRQRWDDKFDHYTDVWLNWLYYDIHFYEKLEFAGEMRPKFADYNELYKALDLNDFWLAFNIYKEANLNWRLRMTEKVRVAILKLKPNKRENILMKCIEIAYGSIVPDDNVSILEIGPAADMVAFEALISPAERLVFMIQLDRLPNLHDNRVTSYRFHHYLKLIAICLTRESSLIAVRQYHKSIMSDADRWLEWSSTENASQMQAFENCVIQQSNLVKPKSYSNMYLNLQEASSITFDEDKQRWLRKDMEGFLDPGMNSYMMEMNSRILKTLADSTSCQGFINLMEKLPNFRIRLTDEERDLIGTPGNVMALGRSGTGKTTCAILRLFSSEVVFRYRSQQAQIKRGLMLAGTKLSPDDIDSRCGLHIIFVTASPVLTNEVRRYYLKLNDHIKKELELRNQREKERKTVDESYIVLEEEIKIEEPEELNLDADEEELASLPPSMNYVREEDFPMFLTVRRLIFMIDGSLSNPFFARDSSGNVIGLTGNSEWHNEMKGVLVISNEYKKQTREKLDLPEEESDDSDSDYDENDLVARATHEMMTRRARDVQERILKSRRQLSFEIDYEYFYKHFWSHIRYMVSSEPLVVWTEISSTIKGSGDSHLFLGWFLSKTTYLERRNRNSMISLDEMRNIYEAFCKYERWKNSQGAYDFQDIVNYILNSLRFRPYLGVPIHYMMVDEVQDLTHSTLTLLLKVTEQSLFFSGDTAQTIAKGVGFRFCDLRSLFRDPSLTHKAPEVKQLTINFRSHGKILDLANSVIALIETLFPQTIDKLAKERSSIEGPMPMIIESQNIEALFLMLFGSTSDEEIQRDKIEFGCSQVIIVRNQQAKEDMPELLKHALVLTVYEAKGLEFDDVLLYNFFTDSPLEEDQWKILTRITRSDSIETFIPSSLEAMELPEVAKLELQMRNFDPAKYSLMCTELKQLYVAITRPKKRLIVFDQNPEARAHMQNYWVKGNLVNQVQFFSGVGGVEISYSNDALEKTTIATSSSVQAWREQGFKMLKNGFHEQAAKCFRYAKDALNEDIAMAYSIAGQASKDVNRATEVIEMKKVSNQKITRSDRRAAKDAETNAKQKFMEAGKMFLKCNLPKSAAKCFFSSGKPLRAARLFEEAGMWGASAEAFSAAKRYREAGDMFMAAREYPRAIECYKMVKDYEKILQVIDTFSKSMNRDEKDKLIKKYVALALEDLMPKVVQVNETDITTRKQKEDATIEEVEEESDEDDEIISEADSISSDEESEEKSEEGFKEVESESLVIEVSADLSENSRVEYSQELGEAKEEVKISESNPFNPSFIALSATNPFLAGQTIQLSATNPFLGQSQAIDEVVSEGSSLQDISISQYNPFATTDKKGESFVLLSDTASQASGTSEFSNVLVFDDSNIEELSNYDPNDEWIQTESIIESLTSACKQDGSLSSDYSIVDNVHATAINRGCVLVKTRADIFVEDETMRKVIRYVSMFSRDVESYLTSLRSADELTVMKELQQSWEMLSLVDMDEIDVSLVSLILDILEYFELYKLCLVVCNRYHLSDRLGRYVTALAHKYSNLESLKPATVDRPGVQARQASVAVLGYTALHNMFEMINPEYLRLKSRLNFQTLGLECFQALVLMGFWKKTVYIMDIENSLAVLWSFSDFRNYKNVFLHFLPDAEVCKATIPNNDFSWLPFKCPSTLEEAEACMLALDSVTWGLNALIPVSLRSTKLVPDLKFKPEFPKYFSLNSAFWDLITKSSNKPGLEDEIVRASAIVLQLNKADAQSALQLVEAWDSLTFIVQLLIAAEKYVAARNSICSLSVDAFHELALAVHKCIRILRKGQTALPFTSQLWHITSAIVAPLGVRLLKYSPITAALPILTHCIMSRASTLIPNFIEKDKVFAADIELKYLYVSQADVLLHVSTDLCKRFSELQMMRFTHFTKEIHSRNLTEIRPTEMKGKAHYIVTTAAGLYGELYLIDCMRRLIGMKQSTEFFRSKTETIDPVTEIKRTNLKSELASYEELEKERYVPPQVIKKLAELRKELAKLSSDSVKIVLANSEILIQLILDNMHYFLIESPRITPTARTALAIKAQRIIMEIDKDTDEIKINKGPRLFWLMSLSKSELMMQELIQARFKPVLKRNFKVAKLSDAYRDFVPWLDMQVFYRLGAWPEFLGAASATLSQIGNCLDSKEVYHLLMRTSIVIALLGTENPKLPQNWTKEYPELSDSRLTLPIMQGDLRDYPLQLIQHLNIALSNLHSHSDEIPTFFEKQSKRIVGLTLQVNSKDVVRKEIKKLSNFTNKTFYIDVSKSTDFNRTYNQTFGTSKTLALTSTLSEADTYRRLDVAWIEEMQMMTKRKIAAKLIRKLMIKHRKAFLKNRRQKQMSNLVEIYGLALDSKQSLEPGQSQKMHRFWTDNRTSMQLLHIVSKAQLNLCHTHYTSKLYTVLDRHYLISKLNRLSLILNDVINLYGSSASHTELSQVCIKVSMELEHMQKDLTAWKTVALPQKTVYNEKMKLKRKWNANWKLKIELHKKPKTGLKRNLAQQQKRQKLKTKGLS